jgi:hypothetical protein
VKKFPDVTIAPTSANVSHGFGTSDGGKNRLNSHQIETSAITDATLRPTSLNVCLLAADRARRKEVCVESEALPAPVGTAIA